MQELTPKLLEQGIINKGLSYEDSMVFTSVLFNWLQFGANWVFLAEAEYSQNLRSLLSNTTKGIARVHKVQQGRIVEVNPRWIAETANGIVDPQAIEYSLQMIRNSGDAVGDAILRLKQDGSEGAVLVFWSISESGSYGLNQEGVEVIRLAASPEKYRKKILEAGYFMSTEEDSWLLPQCDGVAYMVGRDDNEGIESNAEGLITQYGRQTYDKLYNEDNDKPSDVNIMI